jgi:hypothetical protein
VKFRTLLVSAGLLAIVCGSASSQPPPPIPPAPVFPGRTQLPGGPSTPPVVIPTPPAPPPEKTVDELLNELEHVQAQKAALEKSEQALKATLHKKLEQQAERLNKLGVAPKAVEPDRVGQILIEGNTKTADKKILDMLGMSPGQVLQYPKLEAARVKLEKAGFHEPTVEVIPGEPGSTFKDIRVRVSEPEPKATIPPPPRP